MAEEEQRRESDQTLYIWKAKLRAVREVISNVGVPAILVIGFAVIVGGTYLGYFQSPQDAEHLVIQQEVQKAVTSATKSHAVQTEAMQQIVGVLKEMRCDLKHTDSERVRCFRKAINHGAHEPDQ